MPKAGGGYIYLREAYGDKVAFLNGWSSFLVSVSGSNVSLAIAWVTLIAGLIPLSALGIKILAALVIIGLSVVNILGVKVGSFIQNILIVAKLIPILIIILLDFSMEEQRFMDQLVTSSSSSDVSLFTIAAFAIMALL